MCIHWQGWPSPVRSRDSDRCLSRCHPENHSQNPSLAMPIAKKLHSLITCSRRRYNTFLQDVFKKRHRGETTRYITITSNSPEVKPGTAEDDRNRRNDRFSPVFLLRNVPVIYRHLAPGIMIVGIRPTSNSQEDRGNTCMVRDTLISSREISFSVTSLVWPAPIGDPLLGRGG